MSIVESGIPAPLGRGDFKSEKTRRILEAVKAYIEEMEVKVDGEWGCVRELEELIRDGDMPALYREVTELLQNDVDAVIIEPLHCSHCWNPGMKHCSNGAIRGLRADRKATIWMLMSSSALPSMTASICSGVWRKRRDGQRWEMMETTCSTSWLSTARELLMRTYKLTDR